jgi:hypothetical protein
MDIATMISVVQIMIAVPLAIEVSCTALVVFLDIRDFLLESWASDSNAFEVCEF